MTMKQKEFNLTFQDNSLFGDGDNVVFFMIGECQRQ